MKQDYLIGIGFKLLNCLLFPVMSLVMLYCTKSMELIQVMFAQTFLGTIISLIYLLVTKKQIPLTMQRKDLMLYFGRAVTNLVAMVMWILALGKLGINEATALGYTGPLWVFLMAQYIIGEKFNPKILVLIAINMVGMLIILQPKYMDMPWEGVVLALGSIFLWSVYEVICKKQTYNQHYMLQSFYFLSISSLMLAPFALSIWQPINLAQGSLLVTIAVIAVANITAIFLAYSKAPLMLLSPFSYTRLVFTVVITSLLYNISPNLSTFVGAAIIMIANGYITYNLKKVEI